MSNVFFKSLVTHFEGLEEHLNTLDAATGDGDHGTTILKGLRAAADDADGNAGKAFRKAAGGASGSLFGLVVGALESTIAGQAPLDEALSHAAGRISQMGQAKAGDKTMLDALLPAAAAGADPQSVAIAARQGAEATRDMSAMRGRAKYVEGAGVGHLDAGAISVAEMLETFAKAAGRTP
ncbi:MAG: DAK2 domain-containing protein [Alphaproteobacteria bacterium]|nr:DAK2 domain-containing protein [Alphaproteobacteria bacterium]